MFGGTSRIPLILLMLSTAPAPGARAAGCGEPLSGPLHTVQLVVDSLRADPTQRDRMRAQNGRLYTLAEAKWMQTQVRLIGEACIGNREVEATWRVETLLTQIERGAALATDTGGSMLRRTDALLAVGAK
jgi:hypothetical protein